MYRKIILLIVFLICCPPSSASETDLSASPSEEELKKGKVELTEKDSVLPGPLESERLGLYKEIQDAQREGIGVAVYIKYFLSIEDAVKQGEPETAVRQQVESLCKALHDQIKNKKNIKISKVIPKSLPPTGARTAPPGALGGLKFDGYYVHQAEAYGQPNYQIIRFYPNGECASTSVLDQEHKGINATLANVHVWFANRMKRDTPEESTKGNYRITPEHLHFNCGRVDYDGIVADGDKLILEITSHINGNHSLNNVYEYVRLP